MTPQHLRRETDRAIRAANGSTEEQDSYCDKMGAGMGECLYGLLETAEHLGETREHKRLVKAWANVTGHATSCLTDPCSNSIECQF